MRFVDRPTVLFWLTLVLSGYLSASLWAQQIAQSPPGTTLSRDARVKELASAESREESNVGEDTAVRMPSPGAKV